jgi:hypothetical protein
MMTATFIPQVAGILASTAIGLAAYLKVLVDSGSINVAIRRSGRDSRAESDAAA